MLDQTTGPINKMGANDFMFGIQNKTDDWCGSNLIQKDEELFNKDNKNTYFINPEERIVSTWKERQRDMYINHFTPLYQDIYRLIKETGSKLNRTELGKLIGIPITYFPNGIQKGRMTDDICRMMEDSGMIKRKDTNSRNVYFECVDGTKIPEHTFEFYKKGRQSKGEATICNILHESNLEYIWQYKIKDSEVKKCPYDFGILDKEGNVVLLLEVQGEQHRRRIDHFHKNEDDFQKRLKVDKLKKEIALRENYSFMEINDGDLKSTKNRKKIINDITNMMNNINLNNSLH